MPSTTGPIRVIHFGLGPIGAAVVRQVADRKGFKIVGAVDIDPAKVGQDLGDVTGVGEQREATEDRLARARKSFAFESTLSGLGHAARLRRMKRAGYRIEIAYLRLRSSRLALSRIRARVKQGGHDVPRRDVLRRYGRSWANFEQIYRPLAEQWSVYDNSGIEPVLLERGP